MRDKFARIGQHKLERYVGRNSMILFEKHFSIEGRAKEGNAIFY